LSEQRTAHVYSILNKRFFNIIFLEKHEWNEVITSGPKPSPRCDAIVVPYGNSIVVFGGSLTGLIPSSDVYMFHTDRSEWEKLEVEGNPPSARLGWVGDVINHKLYLFGGGIYDIELLEYTKSFTDVHIFDLDTHTWSVDKTEGFQLVPGVGDYCTMFVYAEHLILNPILKNYLFAYDTVCHSWSRLEKATALKTSYASCTRLGNTVYYLGGLDHSTYVFSIRKLDLQHLCSW